MAIVQDVPVLIERLRGHRLFPLGMVSLFTGLRIGEALALRWGHVDLDRKVIQVREAIEETKSYGIRIKPPKTKAGRRDVTLPDVLVDVLRELRKARQETSLKMGFGKLPNDALLFAEPDGSLPSQKYYSKAWSDLSTRAWISSRFQSGWATRSRISPCASMPICSERTTARPQRQSMRLSMVSAG
jgi:integrase